jgi:hypothetical protein
LHFAEDRGGLVARVVVEIEQRGFGLPLALREDGLAATQHVGFLPRQNLERQPLAPCKVLVGRIHDLEARVARCDGERGTQRIERTVAAVDRDQHPAHRGGARASRSRRQMQHRHAGERHQFLRIDTTTPAMFMRLRGHRKQIRAPLRGGMRERLGRAMMQAVQIDHVDVARGDHIGQLVHRFAQRGLRAVQHRAMRFAPVGKTEQQRRAKRGRIADDVDQPEARIGGPQLLREARENREAGAPGRGNHHAAESAGFGGMEHRLASERRVRVAAHDGSARTRSAGCAYMMDGGLGDRLTCIKRKPFGYGGVPVPPTSGSNAVARTAQAARAAARRPADPGHYGDAAAAGRGRLLTADH